MTVSVAYRLSSEHDPGVAGEQLAMAGYPTEVLKDSPAQRIRRFNPPALVSDAKSGI